MLSEKGLGFAAELGLLIGSHLFSAEYYSSSSRMLVPLRQVLPGGRAGGPAARGLHWTMLGEDWLLKERQ
jgi:hypothetical protein